MSNTIFSKVEADLNKQMTEKAKLVAEKKPTDKVDPRIKILKLIKAELIKKNDGREYKLPEPKEINVLTGMKDERDKYIDVYEKANRKDLADTLRDENTVISEFIPALPSDDEVKEFAEKVVKDYLTSKGDGYEPTIKDMGSVMPLVKAKYPNAKGDVVRAALLG